MKSPRILTWLAGAILSSAALHAQFLVQYDFNAINTAIPDADPSGLADMRDITNPNSLIQNVTLTLTLEATGAGAFNGDYYAYLSHGGATAVLLNRAGKTAGNPFGYEDNGFSSVTFSDTAPNGDVHLYQGTFTPGGNGALTGTWAPDGRNVSPSTVLDSTPRTANFAVFNGMSPSGNWTLFVADLSGGGTARLGSWSLAITATPVPEPSTFGLTAGALLLGFALWRKAKA